MAVLGRNRALFHFAHIALGKLINTCHVYTACMSPTLNGSSALQHFECSNVIEIRNGIMFDFYPGLPHTLYSSKLSREKTIANWSKIRLQITCFCRAKGHHTPKFCKENFCDIYAKICKSFSVESFPLYGTWRFIST